MPSGSPRSSPVAKRIPVTDFAARPTVIARQVSWSPDSREIFAAVAEHHVDVIALDGLM
jgi:hypothetical protein